MLTERRIDFIRFYARKLFSAEGAKKLLTEPVHVGHVGFKALKNFAFNVNLREQNEGEEIYRDSIAALCRIANTHDETKSFDQWLPVVATGDVDDLARLFERHGSDKSTQNDYHHIYASVLRRHAPCNILEIGLGTNNLDAVGNMGIWGKPGASLRAFRDWAPKSQVYGADIDKRILFHEDRISTFWIDQTDPKSFDALIAQLGGKKFDLIIDDGLHLPHANLNTLGALLPLLSNEGTLVIEDIRPNRPDFDDLWRLTAAILQPTYDTYYARRKSAYVFVVRRAK